MSAVTIGVLALQGDVREHIAALSDLGETARPVRSPSDLDGVDGIILPGGESTTLSLLLASSGLFDPLAAWIAAGLPVFGTCAGLVLLATDVRGGRPDQRGFGALDCVVVRNGYGRQSESFETSIEVTGALASTSAQEMPAVFIRAPVIAKVGDGVEILGWGRAPGEADARPVVLRNGTVLASAFHPELTSDRRLHAFFISIIGGSERASGEPGVAAGLAR